MSFTSGTGRSISSSTESREIAARLLNVQEDNEELDSYARLSLTYDWRVSQIQFQGIPHPIIVWIPPKMSEE